MTSSALAFALNVMVHEGIDPSMPEANHQRIMEYLWDGTNLV